MDKYNFKKIEKKWQDIWDKEGSFYAKNDSDKPKFYPLVEFPYPSAQGLHVGHPRSYTALDVVARKKRLEGYNVLYPIGWDAFGLPTENFAIKNKIHPKKVTQDNIANFKRQLKSLGLSFDWSREINTTDPEYYKWTQWIFLKLFEKGLAYKKKMPINWCPSCKIGLANEEVIGGQCERCHNDVVRREKSQWMLKITEYADRLIDDLDDVDFIERVKTQQINWIGRSYGMEVDFNFADSKLTVFTTRVDTIFGSSFLAISPEHPVLEHLKAQIENYDEILKYKEESSKKSDFERTEMAKEKTGIQIKGLYAVNPLTKENIPVFVADYVLMSYGTGAVMGVPAHDERDHEFAVKYNLPIIEVVSGGEVNINEKPYLDKSDDSKLVNSGQYCGLTVREGIEKIGQYLEKEGIGVRKTNFKLRDWVFSRQRYWGEPIPLIYCEHCGYVPLDESQLPLKLPEVESYEPTDNGESPLANLKSWVDTVCPKCGEKATRETDTMPQWAGSSWYFLRYTDPDNNKELASKEALNYWLGVDWYNGGMEHTTLHLLYSRFWHKFLYDLKVVDTKEPYLKRTSHGMILGEDGQKMSKSRGNVVNPDEIVDVWGADTFRAYEMFIGDFEKKAPWSSQGIKGCYRFVERIWAMQDFIIDEPSSIKLKKSLHKTIKKVTQDYDSLKANTAIASMMAFLNDVYEEKKINKQDYNTFLILANPVVPHITEEAWQEVNGQETMLNKQKWPVYDETLLVDDELQLPVQVNGKVKATIAVSKDEDKTLVMEKAQSLDVIRALLQGKVVVKEIYVPNKIINIVVK